jgi:hypothetical protein
LATSVPTQSDRSRFTVACFRFTVGKGSDDAVNRSSLYRTLDQGVQADFGVNPTGIWFLSEDEKIGKASCLVSRSDCGESKTAPDCFCGITFEQTTRTTLRGVFIQAALRLRLLRLSRCTLPGPAAGRAACGRAIHSKAIDPGLNHELTQMDPDGISLSG